MRNHVTIAVGLGSVSLAGRVLAGDVGLFVDFRNQSGFWIRKLNCEAPAPWYLSQKGHVR